MERVTRRFIRSFKQTKNNRNKEHYETKRIQVV